MYKQLQNTIYLLTDIGETILVPTEQVDPKTGEIISVQIHQPIYIKSEEKPSEEFIQNLTHDLERTKQEMEAKIEEYNQLVEKVEQVKTDIDNVALPETQSAELIK